MVHPTLYMPSQLFRQCLDELAKISLKIVIRFEEGAERARTRRHLASLDDRMLSDIGQSRALASSEADKPFWKK